MFLIAEAGVNHNGRLAEALKLVDAAKDAGADAVKFQAFSSERLWGDGRIAALELADSDFTVLWTHCRDLGIEFMCTPFGVEELNFLKPLLTRIKIASGCIHRRPLLDAALATGMPIVLSTGMCDMLDVNRAYSVLRGADVTYLHCTSSYPCRLEDVNLKAMDMLHHFGPVGYSDHTTGITVAIAAAARGAVMLEKHLTLDRNQPGPDHKASITPRELKALHLALIEIEAALGDGQKRVMRCEEALKRAWRAR